MEIRDTTSPEEKAQSIAAGHELSDVQPRGILIFGVGLLISIVVVYIGLWAMFNSMLAYERSLDPEQPPLAKQRPEPPAPQLEENPGADLQALQNAEELNLKSIGWADQKKDVAYIPIEVAMEVLPQLLEEKGKIRSETDALPGTPAPEKAEAAPTSEPPAGKGSR